MKRKYFALFMAIFLGCIFPVIAQDRTVNFGIRVMAGYNGAENVPFWMRSNQNGNALPTGVSSVVMASAGKDYNYRNKASWGFGFEGRVNIGKSSDFLLTEGYAKLRLGIFELKSGRTREITGLCDTLLSSGSWSMSGNSAGIPMIKLSVPDFVTVPLLGDLFAFKGNYAHGWMGNWYTHEKTIPNTQTHMLQHALYGRFGKADWKLKLYGGFNHQVVWGDEGDILGEDYELDKWQTFIYVNTAKRYTNDSINQMRIGNHLGSIDLGFDYNFSNIKLFVYRQNLYDAGALYYFANILDGLTGISLTNKRNTDRNIQWKRFLIEFLHTKNQAGEVWSKHTPSPYENYYNNGYYLMGWSYKGMGIGNPLISIKGSIKDKYPTHPANNFVNNRVVALHMGIQADVFHWLVLSKFTYSRNYGTYLNNGSGKVYDENIIEPEYEVFPITGQFSALLEAKKQFKNHFTAGFVSALDIGELYENSFGLMVSISKSF